MEVAFIITVYKKDKLSFFEKAISSIVNQNYGFDKINIYLGVDGPIPVEIQEFIELNESLFFKIIRNEENKGLGFTLNKLIEELENEDLIFRMDSDDICYLDRVSKQVAYMKENPKILISGGAIEEFDERGNINMIRFYPADTQKAKKYIYKASIFAHPAVCFNKVFFNKDFRYNVEHKFSQDVALWFEALEKGIEVGNIKDIILKLRVTPNFYKRRSREKALGEFYIYYHGILRNYGVGVKLIYPVLRLLLRLMPVRLVKLIYKDNFRRILNKS